MEERNSIIEKAYIEHQDMLYKSAYSRMRNEMDAEDALQDTFELGLKYFHTYDENKGAIQTWLNNILHNRCSRILTIERNKGMSLELDEDLLDGEEMNADNELIMKRLRTEIDKEKNPNTRSILYLFFVDRAQSREIADVVNVAQRHVSNVVRLFKLAMKEKYAI